MHKQRLLRPALVVLACVLAATFVSSAKAHYVHANGTWTYRYLTRTASTYCGGQSGSSDPLNVLFWQYGQGNRMDDHANADTHWGYYSGLVPRDHQWICGDTDSAIGDYTKIEHQDFDDQEGHGGWACTCGVRAHFRIFMNPHTHDLTKDMWSTIDVHHEKDVFNSNVHQIDEDWETWEYHIGSEFGAAGHNFYYDYWARQGAQYIQGFFDDGYITRVGGLHNGAY